MGYSSWGHKDLDIKTWTKTTKHSPCVNFGRRVFREIGPFYLSCHICGYRVFLVSLYYPYSFNVHEPVVINSLSFLILVVCVFCLLFLVSSARGFINFIDLSKEPAFMLLIVSPIFLFLIPLSSALICYFFSCACFRLKLLFFLKLPKMSAQIIDFRCFFKNFFFKLNHLYACFKLFILYWDIGD